MRRLLVIAEKIDRLSSHALTVAAFLTLFLILLTTEQVIARYLFGSSSIALQELEWHLFGAIFFLAAAATFAHGGHVRVDILYSRATFQQRAWIDACGTIFLLSPFCFVLTWYGLQFALQARSFAYPTSGELDLWQTVVEFILRGERSADPGGLPARWLIKAVIPVGAILVQLQGCAQLCRYIAVIRGADPALAYPSDRVHG